MDQIKYEKSPDGKGYVLLEDFTYYSRRYNRSKTIKKAYAKHARNLDKVAEVLTAKERDELSRLLKKIGRRAEKIRPD